MCKQREKRLYPTPLLSLDNVFGLFPVQTTRAVNFVTTLVICTSGSDYALHMRSTADVLSLSAIAQSFPGAIEGRGVSFHASPQFAPILSTFLKRRAYAEIL